MILTLEETKQLADDLYNFFGYSVASYDAAYLQRMFISFSNQYKCTKLEELKKLLLQDETLILEFVDKLFINVSQMFRDPAVFQQIREKIIPQIATHPIIKIWSAGCGKGQEVYSLAILLLEAGLYERAIIYATDADAKAIECAMEGAYSVEESLGYMQNYYLSGGVEKFSNYYSILGDKIVMSQKLKDNICFAKHNIITDEVFNTFSLIVCRNMFIYFGGELQSKGLRTFYESLEDEGFLVMGKSEGMHYNQGKKYFKEYDEHNKIYKSLAQGTKGIL